MSWPIRKKSKKIHFSQAQDNEDELKIQQFNTQYLTRKFSINMPKIIQNNNRHYEQKHRHSFHQNIQRMRTRYYDQSLIYLQNQIQSHLSREYIKRYYNEWEKMKKIQTLTQYYKYHQQQPRIFLSQLHQIVSSYQEKKRNLQYERVKDKVQQEKVQHEIIVQKLKHNQKNQQKNRNIESKIGAMNLNKGKKSEKLLKNIHLSYIDFENKPLKQARNEKSNSIKSKKLSDKELVKSNSMAYKDVMPQDTNFLHKRNFNHCNFKQVQNQQLKSLQSKYSHAIGQLFKKKRSSSKKSLVINKLGNKINQNQIKLKQLVNQLDFHQINAQVKEKTDQTKRIMRSKSQTNMWIYKSNKLLKTFKNKIQEKEVKQMPKQTNNQKRQTSKKNQFISDQQTMKKWQSNLSITNKNEEKTKKNTKNVKLFEITKKDLISWPNFKKKPVQQSSTNNQKARVRNKLTSSAEKQNLNCQRDNKRRASSSIYPVIVDLILKDSKIKEIAIDKKKTNTANMFGRLIKGKIRG